MKRSDTEVALYIASEHEAARLAASHRSALYRKNNKQKVKARRRVYLEVKAGRLKKDPCLVCGDDEVEAHHVDYLQPLLIYWLCHVHHVGKRSFFSVH